MTKNKRRRLVFRTCNSEKSKISMMVVTDDRTVRHSSFFMRSEQRSVQSAEIARPASPVFTSGHTYFFSVWDATFVRMRKLFFTVRPTDHWGIAVLLSLHRKRSRKHNRCPVCATCLPGVLLERHTLSTCRLVPCPLCARLILPAAQEKHIEEASSLLTFQGIHPSFFACCSMLLPNAAIDDCTICGFLSEEETRYRSCRGGADRGVGNCC